MKEFCNKKGVYGNETYITLMSNNLSRFDYGVFYPVLKQMAPYPTCSPNNYCIDLSNSKL
jgi:hypothetical protein